MSGNVALVHPVPPLALVAEQFQHQVDGMTTHLKTELGVMQSERLDTFRRKFNNFDVSDLGSSSERRLAAMRLSAQQACVHRCIRMRMSVWYACVSVARATGRGE